MVLRRDSDKFTRPMDHPETRRERWRRISENIDRLELRELLGVKKIPTWAVLPFLLAILFILWLTQERFERAPITISTVTDLRQSPLVDFAATYRGTSSGKDLQDPLMVSIGASENSKVLRSCVVEQNADCVPVEVKDPYAPISLIDSKQVLPAGEWIRRVRLSLGEASDCKTIPGRCSAHFTLSSAPGRPISELKGELIFPSEVPADDIKVQLTYGVAISDQTGRLQAYTPPKTDKNFLGMSKAEFATLPAQAGKHLLYTVAISSIPVEDRTLTILWVSWTDPAKLKKNP